VTKFFRFLGLAIAGVMIIAACSTPTQKTNRQSQPRPLLEAALKNYGPAPELTNEVWLNTDAPLRLSGLRGKVVLIDFWTFG
jgi:hypothetical protein